MKDIESLQEEIEDLKDDIENLEANNERLKELLENIICECNTATYNIKNLNL